MTSNQYNMQLGYDLDSAGDVNNDGFLDLVISAPYFDDPAGVFGNDEGIVFAFYGSSNGLAGSGTPGDWQDAYSTANWKVRPDLIDGARLGFAVDSAGDANLDGYDDVLISYQTYMNHTGAALVFYGSSTGLPGSVVGPESANWFAQGNQYGALFGYSVAGVGDVNKDGADDVIAGAPYYNTVGDDGGMAFGYYGKLSPNAAGDQASGYEDQVYTSPVSVLANDSDPDGGVLTATLAVSPTYGSLVLNPSGIFTYTPNANWNGVDHFQYRAFNGLDFSTPAVVTVTISPVNDAPSFVVGGNVTVNEDAGPQTVANWAQSISPGPADEAGQALTFTFVDVDLSMFAVAPAVSPDGTLTFTPAANVFDHCKVSVALKDNGGVEHGGQDTSPAQYFNININPVNDPPTANDDAAGTAMNTPVLIPALANDSDVDSATLLVINVGTPAHGTAAIETIPEHGKTTSAGTHIRYTPATNYYGTDVFTYTISDVNGGFDTATINVTVRNTNTPPVAVNDSANTLQDTAVAINVLANDSDADHDPLAITYASAPAHGSVVISGIQIIYTPAAGFSGQDTFTYTITDGFVTMTATVTVTVIPPAENKVYLPLIVH